MASKLLYRGYHIVYEPKPIPDHSHDWSWWHDDYDGAPDSRDRRCGTSASLLQAQADIDDLIEELE